MNLLIIRPEDELVGLQRFRKLFDYMEKHGDYQRYTTFTYSMADGINTFGIKFSGPQLELSWTKDKIELVWEIVYIQHWFENAYSQDHHNFPIIDENQFMSEFIEFIYDYNEE